SAERFVSRGTCRAKSALDAKKAQSFELQRPGLLQIIITAETEPQMAVCATPCHLGFKGKMMAEVDQMNNRGHQRTVLDQYTCTLDRKIVDRAINRKELDAEGQLALEESSPSAGPAHARDDFLDSRRWFGWRSFQCFAEGPLGHEERQPTGR